MIYLGHRRMMTICDYITLRAVYFGSPVQVMKPTLDRA